MSDIQYYRPPFSSATDKVIRSLSDLPVPSGGIIQLEDNVCYRFKGLVDIGTNKISLGASNTIYGVDKSDDGIIYSGIDAAIIGIDRSITISNIYLFVNNPLAKGLLITNSVSFSTQVRECIIVGSGQAGTINGGDIVAINNNVHFIAYGWDIAGNVNKLGISTNYFENGNSDEHIHIETGSYNIIKIIDNDFTIHSPNIGILVDNDAVIGILGGGSIVGNTFNGDGQYISGVATDTLYWIIENNGRSILNTSDTVTQKKVRSEAELQLYLSLPDPTLYSYLLDAKDFIITQPIVVPSEGVNGGLTFFGLGNNFTTLKTSTPGIAMFTGGGNLFLNDMIVTADGTGSSVFGMTSSSGFEAVEMLNINFQFCESLGYLDGFRQGLIINGFMIGDKQGLEFRGTWSGGFRIDSSRFIFTPATGSYMFKGAVGQTFGSRFITNANSTIGTGSIGYDFTESNFVNDANFQLIEAQFSGGGTPVNGITASSRKSLWRDCVGVDDTFQGCVYRNTANTTTDIVTTGTYVEMAVSNTVTEDVWFQSQSSGFFTPLLISSLPINVRIDLLLALQSGNNNEIEVEVRKYNSTNTAFTAIDNFKMTSNGGTLGTRVEPISLASFVRMTQNERIRIFVRNNSGNTDVLCESSSKLIISKR